jgi:hypothetical protein
LLNIFWMKCNIYLLIGANKFVWSYNACKKALHNTMTTLDWLVVMID